jgi:hypothetical protein
MRFRIPDGDTPGVLQLYACLSAEDLIRVYRSEDEENATLGSRLRAGLFSAFHKLGVDTAPEAFVDAIENALGTAVLYCSGRDEEKMELTLYPPDIGRMKGNNGHQLMWEIALRDLGREFNPMTVSWHGTNLSQVLFNCGILASLKNSTVAEAVEHAEERATYPLEIEVSSHT